MSAAQADIRRLKYAVTGCFGGVWGDEPNGVDDLTVVRVADFNREKASVELGDNPTVRAIPHTARNRRILSKGDLLIEKSGGGEQQPVGNVVLFDADVNAVCSNFVARMPVSSDCDPRFTCYVFRSLYSEARNVCHIKQTSGIQNLDTDSYLNESAWLPARDVQERIANFLDDKTVRIDALIAAKERLAESLKDIEEVTAFDMVTRGLSSNSKRTSFVEPWLGEVPLHWGLAKIRSIATVGNGSTPKRDNEDYWAGGETPWLNSGSVNSPRIVEASDYVTPLAIKECHLPTVRAGSTVVALTGQGKTRGRAAFAEFETTINQHLAFMSVFDQKVSDEYLWVALTGFYSVFRYISDGEGSTKGALTCEELNKFRLPIPPPNEQAQIVAAYLQRLKTIDALKEHNELHISRLREYRSSLISAAVTGQLDVSTYKVAAADPH